MGSNKKQRAPIIPAAESMRFTAIQLAITILRSALMHSFRTQPAVTTLRWVIRPARTSLLVVITSISVTLALPAILKPSGLERHELREPHLSLESLARR